MRKNGAGAIGEGAAEAYLVKKGYRIAARNFRCRSGELDIVAYDGNCTVFVEVKTRKSHAYGRPSEFVDSRKQEKLVKAAMYYLDGKEIEMRFDVVEITYEIYNGTVLIKKINHIKNAFLCHGF